MSAIDRMIANGRKNDPVFDYCMTEYEKGNKLTYDEAEEQMIQMGYVPKPKPPRTFTVDTSGVGGSYLGTMTFN